MFFINQITLYQKERGFSLIFIFLSPILKQFTKAVLLDEPQDLLKWSANYFAQLANLPLPFGANGEYLDGVGVAKKAKEEKGSGITDDH